MKHISYLIVCAAVMLLTVGCNEQKGGNTYTIEGTTAFMDEGQLELTNDDGEVIDTIDVKNGKFSYSAQADSVQMYKLTVIGRDSIDVEFFTEQGTISIDMNEELMGSIVKGTVANDALQEMTNDIRPIYAKIYELEKQVRNDTAQTFDQWAIAERYNQLASELGKHIKAAAVKNAENELGYMLVSHFMDPSEDEAQLREIIDKMPQNFRERQHIKELEEMLKASEATSIGQQISDFSLDTPQGEALSVMSEVKKNKITILDFWASWCGPCRREMPFMKDLYAEYQPKGLGIVGISLDESAADWNRAIEELKLVWPQISDLKGWESAAAQMFQVRAIPYLVILDSEGKILQKGLRGEDLKEFISQQLQ